MDQQLRQQRRRVDCDPDNRPDFWRLALRRVRVEGDRALLSLLKDRRLWSQAPLEVAEYLCQRLYAHIDKDFDYLGCRRYQSGGQGHFIGRYVHKRSHMQFHLIPGRPAGSEDVLNAACTVSTPPLFVARFPILEYQWAGLMSRRRFRARKRCRPQAGVSYAALELFLSAFSKRRGCAFNVRLPRNHEWEWTSRAGSPYLYFWGPRYDSRRCWSRSNSHRRLQDVFQHKDSGNAFGLVDTLGHVGELCDRSGRVGIYQGVVCGGSIDMHPSYCTVQSRRPVFSERFVGARLVANVRDLF